MAFTTRPLTPAFGAELENVDLSQPLDDETTRGIREAWLRNKVLLFRNQRLCEEDMIRFGRGLGELEIHVRNDATTSYPEVLLVTNKKENGRPIGVLGDAEAPWHIDQIYQQRPTLGTMLYGVEIPPEGGNTHVCDMATAYQRLPDTVKERIQGRRAVNSAAYFNATYDGGMSAEQLARVPDVSHPLVRTHPMLGSKSLFMSPGHTSRIEGLSQDESDSLLATLRECALNDDNIYVHEWRVGDVLMWDNTQTMHRRDPFDGSQLRLLKRISFMYPPDLRIPF